MAKKMLFDFSGWATRNNLKCSDGRTIVKDAFMHCDGRQVPLVWNHRHDGPSNVLGHALLENREEGVYAYCTFNETKDAQDAKECVKHGDIVALSIFANNLRQQGASVLHGAIREVSLVIAGANPGAFIDSVLCHGEASDEEAIIYTGEPLTLCHADDEEEKPEDKSSGEDESKKSEEKSEDEETVADVYNAFSEKQKKVVAYMIDEALKEADDEEGTSDDENKDSEGGENTMKHNVFDEAEKKVATLSHSDMTAILTAGKRNGSLKDAYLAHAESTGTEYAEATQSYGINGVDFLFPEARTVGAVPQLIARDMGWVQKVMRATHHTPFARIKSVMANITEEDARARGYIKGKQKKDEVFALLKRTTTPTTIYKKQKMDRDDILDIVDFDVVAFLKGEMRLMLDEEIARAAIVGDGRLSSSDDKIPETNIRPIWTDEDLYTIKALMEVETSATASDKAKAFIKAAIKARKKYKGSGSPMLLAPEDVITDCLLIEDTTGRIIYDSVEKLAKTLRVSEIVSVPVMEGLTRTDSEGNTLALWGIIVNLKDYTMGADKGGAVNMFDDFDIDFNQQKYLIETRCSGALTKPYSAIVIEEKTATVAG